MYATHSSKRISCDELNDNTADQDSCDATTSDDGSKCVWCSISSFGVCVSEDIAEKMKGSIPGLKCDDDTKTDDAVTTDDMAPATDDTTPNDDSTPGIATGLAGDVCWVDSNSVVLTHHRFIVILLWSTFCLQMTTGIAWRNTPTPPIVQKQVVPGV